VKQLQVFFCLLVWATGCSTGSKQTEDSNSGNGDRNRGHTVRYAERFKIDESGNILTINYPFSAGLAAFVYSITLPLDSRAITIPVHDPPPMAIPACPARIAVLSTTHLPFIQALGLTDKLVAIDNGKRVYDAEIRARVLAGKVAEVGNADGSINFEKLIAVKPDLVILSGTGSPEMDDNPKLRELKLVTLVDVEWKENHPLGRAEWIKVFGLLCGKKARADSVFAAIETRYNSLKQKASHSRTKPTVFTGRAWKGTWFAPGGRSFAANFLTDAGSRYVWANDSSVGSVPLKFEAVFLQAAAADYWVNLDEFATQAQLLAEDARYAQFEAFRKQQLYNHNHRVNEYGGNDYWEQGILEPEEVLADLIQIFHPELLSGRTMRYYQKLPTR